MWFNFLTEATEQQPTPWTSYVLMGVIVVAVIVMFVFSGKKNKQSQQEYIEQLAAIGPGNKVKTAGGINGIVVEVCEEDNTIILETGSETTGKSYLKIDKELIAQTDAKGPTQLAREAAEAARKAEKERKAQEKNGKAPVEEIPTEEAPAEVEAPAESAETTEE